MQVFGVLGLLNEQAYLPSFSVVTLACMLNSAISFKNLGQLTHMCFSQTDCHFFAVKICRGQNSEFLVRFDAEKVLGYLQRFLRNKARKEVVVLGYSESSVAKAVGVFAGKHCRHANNVFVFFVRAHARIKF